MKKQIITRPRGLSNRTYKVMTYVSGRLVPLAVRAASISEAKAKATDAAEVNANG